MPLQHQHQIKQQTPQGLLGEAQLKELVGFLNEMIPPSEKPRIVIRYICYHIHEGKMYVDSYLS